MSYKLYETLGLNKNNNPSQKEIKAAYHKLALQYHPDKNPNNSDKFKEISNAYSILSDEGKKHEYDNLGDNNYNEGMNNGGGGINPDDLFEHFFGGNHFSRFNFDIRSNKPKKCSNIIKKIDVTLEEVYTGIDNTMKINVKNNCLNCIKRCDACNGKGVIQNIINRGFIQQISQSTCEICGGRGEKVSLNKNCSLCEGEGTYYKEHTAKLKVNAGFPNNYKTLFKGLGEQPKTKNQEAGDLVIHLEINENKNFTRINDDLYYKLKIDFIDTIVGKNITIPYFDEEIKLNTSEYGIILNKNEYKIKNKGLPNFNQNKKGDMIICVEVNNVKMKKDIDIDKLKQLLKDNIE